MTPAEAIRGTAVRIRQLPSELQKVERNAGRRAARALRQAALDRFTATGLGRAIFRKGYAPGEKAARTKQLRAVFGTPRVESPAEGYLRITYTLHGIAALVEQGGRTKEHEIRPSRGPRALALKTSGGVVFAAHVNHKGSRIPQNRFLDAAGADALQVLEAELEAGYAKAAQKV